MLEFELKATTNFSKAENDLTSLGKNIEDLNNQSISSSLISPIENSSLYELKDSFSELKRYFSDLTKSSILKPKDDQLSLFDENNKSEDLSKNIENIEKVFEKLDVSLNNLNLNINGLSNDIDTKERVKGVLGVKGVDDKTADLEFVKKLMVDVANNNIENASLSVFNKVNNSMISKGDKLQEESGGDFLSMLFSSAGKAGKIAAAAIATLSAGTLAMSKRYERDLPGVSKLLSAYGTNSNDEKTNQELGDEYRRRIIAYNQGTGLTNNEFIDIAASFGRYGVRDLNKSGEMAKLASVYANRTNGDVQQYVDYIGKLERYNGNGIESINNAFAASKAAGLSENQFGEFLSNLERVFESGISKGFTKSTKEVTESYLLLSKLSGGHEMFKENGMQRYLQMSDSLANATNLNNVSSFIAYNVADDLIKQNGARNLLGNNDLNYIKDSGASWINTMAFLEKGDLNSNFLSGLYKEINKTYGDDTASKVLTYKELFGLNYEGSIQMFNLQERLAKASDSEKENITKEISSLQENPEFKNAETRLADSFSLLDKSIHDLAKGSFEIKATSLDAISTTVDLIYEAIVNPSTIVEDEPIKQLTEKAADYALGKDVENWHDKYEIPNINTLMGSTSTEQYRAIEYYLKQHYTNPQFGDKYNEWLKNQREQNPEFYEINSSDKLLDFLYYFDNLTKSIDKLTNAMNTGIEVN